jgi:hypothetical protein
MTLSLAGGTGETERRILPRKAGKFWAQVLQNERYADRRRHNQRHIIEAQSGDLWRLPNPVSWLLPPPGDRDHPPPSGSRHSGDLVVGAFANPTCRAGVQGVTVTREACPG